MWCCDTSGIATVYVLAMRYGQWLCVVFVVQKIVASNDIDCLPNYYIKACIEYHPATVVFIQN